MIRLADLRSLRVALDQALEHLAPVLPALEAWQASQTTAPEPQEHAPEPAAAPVPAPALSSSDALPTPGLFDPLPAPVPPARRRAGNGMASTSCQRGGSAVKQQARGARKKFCSASCRAKAKAARVAQRAADPGLEPLPDRVERPFEAYPYYDDPCSDAELLRPPRLDWELEEHAAP